MTCPKSASEKTQAQQLNLCVCGWYFVDDWYASLLRLHTRGSAKVFVVANQEHSLLDFMHLPYAVRENKGLEFGAYNYYLTKVWQGGPIVFSHDDMAFRPVLDPETYNVGSGEMIFHRFGDLEFDQGYVFTSRHDDVINDGKHGRMIYMSHRLAEWCKELGGIWYDKTGKGHYNAGIDAFEKLMKDAGTAGFDVRNKIYFPGIAHGYRGEFKGVELK